MFSNIGFIIFKRTGFATRFGLVRLFVAIQKFDFYFSGEPYSGTHRPTLESQGWLHWLNCSLSSGDPVTWHELWECHTCLQWWGWHAATHHNNQDLWSHHPDMPGLYRWEVWPWHTGQLWRNGHRNTDWWPVGGSKKGKKILTRFLIF